MVEFIKTSDQYPRKFNFNYFFSSIILPLSAGEKYIFKKRCLEETGKLLLRGFVMIKIWRKVLLECMSKNYQIQFFDSQMYFPVILTP